MIEVFRLSCAVGRKAREHLKSRDRTARLYDLHFDARLVAGVTGHVLEFHIDIRSSCDVAREATAFLNGAEVAGNFVRTHRFAESIANKKTRFAHGATF